MAATGIVVDPETEQQQQARNLLDTVLLIGGLVALASTVSWLLWGWLGVVLAVLLAGLVALVSPHVPSALIMRIYRAIPIDPRNGADLYDALDELSTRAGLPRRPDLMVIPSLALNAFSAGAPDAAAIALSEGLLRKLSLRELTGVMAHEISHIRNNDLRIMALADVISRVMQWFSWAAVLLLVLYLPAFISGARVPWLAILLLYLAPAISTLLQLALARTRELDADLDAVTLTGDPAGLASALTKIERYEGSLLEDLVFPGARRVPVPSMLRTHPATETRIERLRQIVRPPVQPPVAAAEDGPRFSLVGHGPVAMRPRYRIPGLWF